MDRNCNLVGDTGEEQGRMRKARGKRRRPFKIEYRARKDLQSAMPRWSQWQTWRRYCQKAERDQALLALTKSRGNLYFEYRAGEDNSQ